MTISEAIEISHKTAVSKGWWEKERSIPEVLALIHSEVSEALEEYRQERPLNGTYCKSITPLKPEGFTYELADILIRVFDLAGGLRLPLEEALERKMKYNKTRPHRHGGKRA